MVGFAPESLTAATANLAEWVRRTKRLGASVIGMRLAMKRRPLGKTGLELSTLGFGASSLGAEFRPIDVSEALRCVQVALDRGINYIDTAAYYGRGMSEVMLGRVLPQIPRESYVLSTKLGRYAPQHFDFSAKRVRESIDVSLERMGIEHLDIVFCHDIEFVDTAQIVEETLPALRKEVEAGKVRFVGISGYPMKIFLDMLTKADLDVIMTYNHYTLQNDMALALVEPCQQAGTGVITRRASRRTSGGGSPATNRSKPKCPTFMPWATLSVSPRLPAHRWSRADRPFAMHSITSSTPGNTCPTACSPCRRFRWSVRTNTN